MRILVLNTNSEYDWAEMLEIPYHFSHLSEPLQTLKWIFMNIEY